MLQESGSRNAPCQAFDSSAMRSQIFHAGRGRGGIGRIEILRDRGAGLLQCRSERRGCYGSEDHLLAGIGENAKELLCLLVAHHDESTGQLRAREAIQFRGFPVSQNGQNLVSCGGGPTLGWSGRGGRRGRESLLG